MKAFKVWIPRLNEVYDRNHFEIVTGETPGKVRYSKLLNLDDVYPELSFADIRVRRAPEFDTPDDRIASLGWKSTCNSCGGSEAYGIFAR